VLRDAERMKGAQRPNQRERRIDPRIERSRHVILRAALDELGEVGYGAFAIESVAARAGVGKSTIYRHWAGKLALIADAFKTFHEQQGPNIESGSPRERVERIVHHVAEIVVGSTFSACIPALIDGAERDRDLRRFHYRFQTEVRQPLISVIAEGVAARDFPAHLDPELATLALLGVIFYRRLMSNEPFDPGRASELVDTVLGVSPASSSG
jgi:TetR/AcrR family transcriptional regulator of autoinduction and epiphytic fitness